MNDIFVGISRTLGIRGVHAGRVIKKGECIEKCPVILIPIEQEYTVDETIFSDYVFEWSKQFNALALGYGSLYNHSFNANSEYRHDFKNKRLSFYAVKNIGIGEEITINYNGLPRARAKLDAKYLSFK